MFASTATVTFKDVLHEGERNQKAVLGWQLYLSTFRDIKFLTQIFQNRGTRNSNLKGWEVPFLVMWQTDFMLGANLSLHSTTILLAPLGND